MKALSLTQPWATLVVTGEKKIETRSWKTKHRGLIAIHAAKGFPSYAKEVVGVSFFKVLEKHGIFSSKDFPLGVILGTAEIAACLPTNGGQMHLSNLKIEVQNNEITDWQTSTVSYQKPAPGTPENMFGDYSANRYMWFLEHIRMLKNPIPCKGALSLWEVPKEIERIILSENSY